MGNSDTDNAPILKRISELEQELKECRESEMPHARTIAEEIIRLARENGLRDKQIMGMSNLARIINRQIGPIESLKVAREAIDLLDDSTDDLLIARAYNSYGGCLSSDHKYVEALEAYRISKSIYEKQGDPNGVAAMMLNIGTAFDRLGYYKKAYQAFVSSIEMVDEEVYPTGKAVATNNLGKLLLMHGDDPESAEPYLLEALELNRKAGRKTGEAFCLRDLGHLNIELGKLDEAESYYRKAVELWEELGSKRFVCFCMNVIAEIMEHRGELEEAEKYRLEMVEEFSVLDPRLLAQSKSGLASLRVKMGITENARESFMEYLELLDDTPDDMREKAALYDALCSLAQREEDYREALDFFRMKAELDHKIDLHESEQDIVRMRLKSEYEYSERQRKLLEEQKGSLEKANAELEEAMSKIKTLRGMLPICSHCKKIRNDKGYWERIERYISEHSDAVFSHGLCPECRRELYPEYSQ